MGPVAVSACGSRRGDGVCALASVSKVTQFLPMEVGRVFNVAFDIEGDMQLGC
jgi:hypothetical protein